MAGAVVCSHSLASAEQAGTLVLTIVARRDATKLEFALHPPQFRIDDSLDHPPEVAADAAQRAVDVLSMYSGKTIIARPISPVAAMRPTVIIVNQGAISVIADKKMSHVRSPPSAQARAVERNMPVTA